MAKGYFVGVVYTANSVLSDSGENRAKFIGSLLGLSGFCQHVSFLRFPTATSCKQQKSSLSEEEPALKVVLRNNPKQPISLPKQNYSFLHHDTSELAKCDLLLICCDAINITQYAQVLNKALDKQKKTVIISMQSCIKNIQELEKCFPDNIVLHAAVCFHVVQLENGAFTSLSNGSYCIERLSRDKASALHYLDLLECTGIPVLCTGNITASKWGFGLLSIMSVLSALTDLTLKDALDNRACRLMLAGVLHESLEVLDKATNGKNWIPDFSANSFLNIHMMLVVLPLPNFLFNMLMKIVSLGLYSDPTLKSLIQSDMNKKYQTEFDQEFDDFFQLAGRHDVSIPTFQNIKEIFNEAIRKKEGSPKLNPIILYSNVLPPKESRKHCINFFLKLFITFSLGLLLLAYFKL